MPEQLFLAGERPHLVTDCLQQLRLICYLNKHQQRREQRETQTGHWVLISSTASWQQQCAAATPQCEGWSTTHLWEICRLQQQRPQVCTGMITPKC